LFRNPKKYAGHFRKQTKALGIRRWGIKAQDRKQWSAILREAKA
jgi:hypothetical protein